MWRSCGKTRSPGRAEDALTGFDHAARDQPSRGSIACVDGAFFPGGAIGTPALWKARVTRLEQSKKPCWFRFGRLYGTPTLRRANLTAWAAEAFGAWATERAQSVAISEVLPRIVFRGADVGQPSGPTVVCADVEPSVAFR